MKNRDTIWEFIIGIVGTVMLLAGAIVSHMHVDGIIAFYTAFCNKIVGSSAYVPAAVALVVIYWMVFLFIQWKQLKN
jgi:hypothetical protein